MRRVAIAVTLIAPLLLPMVLPLAKAEAAGGIPGIHHVWVINLENKGFDTTFGANSPAPYLSKTLTAQGAFLRQYYGIGHASLGNYIAEISGQATNPSTRADCTSFTDFTPDGLVHPDGQAGGDGCIYPIGVTMLGDQLTAAGLSWKGYMEDMGNIPARESATCGHPAVNSADGTQAAVVGDQYATRHDPFVYFHHLIDDAPTCAAHVVNTSGLKTDLASIATTPNYSMITPNLCNDGHDAPCVGGTGVGGLAQADGWLQTMVPMITGSPAFQKDGMLLITFDESDGGSTASCCGQIAGPNEGGVTVGGGRVGAVVLSKFVKPGTVTDTGYNHYSQLRTIEDIFGLSHLGYAGQAGLTSFGSDVFTNPTAQGYWFTATDGGVFNFGPALFYGSTGSTPLNKPVVTIAATPSRSGYWLAATDGGIFSFGDAKFFGSTGSITLNKPIVGMTPTPTGGGYWLVASDGGIFAFGDAQFFGSTGSITLNKPIVAMAATPTGLGYWLVASDGGIFAFGDAQFFGSTGSITLNKPIVAMASTPSGGGYWLTATDGGIFAFGDAAFQGSTGSITLNKPIVAMARTSTGGGYWLTASDGGVFAFGDALFLGSTGSIALNQPIVAMAAT